MNTTNFDSRKLRSAPFLARMLGAGAGLACLTSLSSLSSLASAQFIYSNGSSDPNVPALSLTGESISGVAAPANSMWSETPGAPSGANMLLGISCYSEDSQAGSNMSFRVADDFNIDSEFGWNVQTITLYVYQPGHTGITSPVLRGNMRIWSGQPGVAGSSILFGDVTTNRIVNNVPTSYYRIAHTGAFADFSTQAPGTTNRIWEVTMTIGSIHFPQGQYWLDMQLISTDPNKPLYCIPASTAGLRGGNGTEANAQILMGTGLQPVWESIVDDGKPTSANDALQDLAFSLTGEIFSSPCPADFNQDGGVDGIDVESFFQAWTNGDLSADVNTDGGVDGQDVGVFFTAWENGGC